MIESALVLWASQLMRKECEILVFVMPKDRLCH